MGSRAEKKKPLVHPWGRKASPPRYHPHSYKYHVRTFAPDNGGACRPRLRGRSRANKRHGPGRLPAADPPSLGTASTLFSRSTHCNQYLYHTIAGIARGKPGKSGKFPAPGGPTPGREGSPRGLLIPKAAGPLPEAGRHRAAGRDRENRQKFSDAPSKTGRFSQMLLLKM